MIPQVAKSLFDAFKKAGEELYLVGGSVRDKVIFDIDHRRKAPAKPFEPKDLDFATSAVPEKTQEILRKMGMPVIPIGVEFGTVATKLAQFDVEITTYRCKESYTKGSRKPAVVFGTSLEEDLKRRDFTMNAMAMDSDGNLIDPFHGSQSLVQGQFFTPAEDPTEPFMEDPLRMIRAYRFESQLPWIVLHDKEHQVISKLKAEIHNVSAERIFAEMSKLLMGSHVRPALEHMGESGLLGEIFPEVQKMIDFKQNQGKYHSKLVWPHVLDVVHNSPPILEVRWAALFHDIAKPDTYSETSSGVHFYQHEPIGASQFNGIADRLKVSSDFKQEINFLIYHHLRMPNLCVSKSVSKSALRRFIRDCGPYLENLYLLSKADITSHHPNVVQEKRHKLDELKATLDKIIEECDVRQLKLPKGLGKEVAAALNLPHGPALGRVMRRLNDALVAGTIAEDGDFIAAAKDFHHREEGLRELTRMSQEMGLYDQELKQNEDRKPTC